MTGPGTGSGNGTGTRTGTGTTRTDPVPGACEGHECTTRQAAGRAAGRTAAGYRLCTSCRGRLTLGIRQLPDLYRDCERVLGSASAKGLRERTSGGPLPGAPFNAAAAEARAAIIGVLGSWSGLVAHERRVTPPQRTIGTLSVFLLRHTDWLAAHPAAAEATREVARLVVKAHRVAHPDQIRRVALGACVEPGCDGRLSATVRVQAPGTYPAVQCDAEPLHTWAGHQWTRLRRLMPGAAAGDGTYGGGAATAGGAPASSDPAPAAGSAATASPAGSAAPAPAALADRWLTAGDISRLWSTPVGTVYRLASEQRWRRHHRSGRTYYSEADAHDCFSRRAERARQG